MIKTTKQRNDKLTLSHETVRVLQLAELSQAAGGSVTSWFPSAGQGGNSRATCCQQ